MPDKVMLIGDHLHLGEPLEFRLNREGFFAKGVDGISRSFEEILESRPSIILTSYQLDDGTASDLLAWLKSSCLRIPVIVLLSGKSTNLAARAINDGAACAISEPVDIGQLMSEMHASLRNVRIPERDLANRLSRARYVRDPFLGESSCILKLESASNRISEANCSVLIQGETGTGKGVLANWLHKRGPRADQPFVDLNCAGLSRELLESEIFGHKKGAFTGAILNKIGLLEAANRGTLFLDEIGDMDLQVQAKILKVVEEKRFYRLGEVQERKVDVQIIAATHRDLKKEASGGRFRTDLYFRISTLCLHIPPLRERMEDIPLLTDVLLDQFSWDLKRNSVKITDSARSELQRYTWPGNIRELRNVLERATILSEDGVIRQTGVEFEATDCLKIATNAFAGNLTLAQMERHYILLALESEGGHVSRAAKRLGMPRSSLYAKIREHDLTIARAVQDFGAPALSEI
jgi:DNA-binding NtrC family response regulator